MDVGYVPTETEASCARLDSRGGCPYALRTLLDSVEEHEDQHSQRGVCHA